MKNVFQSVGMGIALFFMSTISVFGTEIPIKVAWDAPTTNVDGTPLVDLSHYVIYACDQEITTNDLDNDGKADVPVACSGTFATFQVSGDQTKHDFSYLAPSAEGTVYMRVTTWDTSGNESLVSNQVDFSFDKLPPSSAILRIILP